MTLVEKLINEHNQAVQYTEESQYKDGFLSGMKKAIDIVKNHKGWISVDYKLPKQSGYYLIYCFNRFYEYHEIRIKYFSGEYFITDPDVDVLYWQPLPKDPKKY